MPKIYTCPDCKVEFDQKSHYDRHINKKNYKDDNINYKDDNNDSIKDNKNVYLIILRYCKVLIISSVLIEVI
jgi:uncharacterized C2H2 Zn-finger protein